MPNYTKNIRRSQTINIAFTAVRNCIPHVSNDTKLSKIQTLRLVISYIRFLMSCLGDYRFLLLMSDADRKLHERFFYTIPFSQIYAIGRNERKRESKVIISYQLEKKIHSWAIIYGSGPSKYFKCIAKMWLNG